MPIYKETILRVKSTLKIFKIFNIMLIIIMVVEIVVNNKGSSNRMRWMTHID